MKDSIQTFSNGPKDRFYKSFTTLIPDENGKIVGSVCVNLDVSDLLNAQRALGAFVQYPMTHHAPTNDIDALATKNVDDILKYYMKQAELPQRTRSSSISSMRTTMRCAAPCSSVSSESRWD